MKEKKFSIGFINCDELGFWTGELSVYSANMAKLYRNNGHKVHLFVRNHLPIPNNLKGIYIHFVKAPKKIGIFTLLKYRFNKKLALRDLYKEVLYNEVKKISDKGFIDVLDIPEKTGIGEALLKLNIPTTVSFHYGQHLEKNFEPSSSQKQKKSNRIDSIIEFDEKKLLSEANSYISPSKHIADIYRKKNLIPDIELISYTKFPFEMKFFSNFDIKDDKSINILISTRYSKKKRLEQLLIMITNTVLKQNYTKEIKFTFVGIGNPKFIKLLKSNPFYGKTIFYENYSVRPKFKDYYSNSDIIIVPTTSESFSYTVIEAIFSKRLVIVAGNSGNDELIDDGINGFVFENDNFEHLARIINSVIVNPKMRNFISENATDGLYKKFDYNKIYQTSKYAYIKALKK